MAIRDLMNKDVHVVVRHNPIGQRSCQETNYAIPHQGGDYNNTSANKPLQRFRLVIVWFIIS